MDDHDPAADKLDKERPYAGDHKPVLGAKDVTDRRQTASAKVEEKRDVAAHGVGCTAGLRLRVVVLNIYV